MSPTSPHQRRIAGLRLALATAIGTASLFAGTAADAQDTYELPTPQGHAVQVCGIWTVTPELIDCDPSHPGPDTSTSSTDAPGPSISSCDTGPVSTEPSPTSTGDQGNHVDEDDLAWAGPNVQAGCIESPTPTPEQEGPEDEAAAPCERYTFEDGTIDTEAASLDQDCDGVIDAPTETPEDEEVTYDDEPGDDPGTTVVIEVEVDPPIVVDPNFTG
jgi:hypothetical protein